MAKVQAKRSARKGHLSLVSGTSRKRQKQILARIWAQPASKYVLGGIGLALLGRVGYRIFQRYPQISEFFKENLDVIESKLAEFRGNVGRTSHDRNAGIH